MIAMGSLFKIFLRISIPETSPFFSFFDLDDNIILGNDLMNFEGPKVIRNFWKTFGSW